MTTLRKDYMRRPHAIRKAMIGAIGFFAALLVVSAAQTAAGEEYQRYVMDQNYFSCNIPANWEFVRDRERDEDYQIYEIQLVRGAVSIYVSYYAGNNEDFNGYEDYIKRNSSNVMGETRNKREN